MLSFNLQLYFGPADLEQGLHFFWEEEEFNLLKLKFVFLQSDGLHVKTRCSTGSLTNSGALEIVFSHFKGAFL